MSERRPLRTIAEANAEIARLRAQIGNLQSPASTGSAQAAPIAIVGMGCRFPGQVDTPEAFWELLASGRDVLDDIPASRWDVDAYYDPAVPAPGKMYVRQGHYLDDIDQFDPHFFGLSPREAQSLDPQQRLILEVTWETLEHAGIAASSLKGGKTGVFVGQYWDDYSMQRIFATDIREVDRYAQLSGLRSLIAGRICHILDSHGPAMQVDTACSSSSLAVHLACQSLRSGESDLALAGGVSLILAPEHLVGICQMQALSPSGRCKTFDADADGFGQGEGAGMVALKRLPDAQTDGDRVLAVIHGSCANHDGHARTVTTPSGPAQRAMLEDAVRNSGLHPHQIGYVETHGTGTPLGDPIEVLAIARVLCEAREAPLYLGSVKTNVGHLDAAAGIVGLMKVVLSLQHGMIPPHLNFATPNPRIPWDEWPLRVPTETVPWPSDEKIAGVSAFGMSGTNVHLIVGEAPAAPPNAVTAQTTFADQLFTLSAQSQAALQDTARRYAQFLADFPDTPEAGELARICYSAATGRTHFTHRAAFVAESAAELQQQLTGLASGAAPPDVAIGTTGRRRPALAFLFTGQGAQHVGMGRELYGIQPTFRFWLDRCAQILDEQLEKPLLDVLWSGTDLHQTAYTQPALFAVEYALSRLWQEWGVEPDILLGHSIGEYTAACVAGVFSLKDGLKLVAARGRLMQSLPAGGAMVSVAADEAVVATHLQGLKDQVSVAAQNGPRSIVISGQGDAVQSVAQALGKAGIKTTQLQVSHAFHSPLMDPILAEFREVAAKVEYRAPATAVISNVTGEELGDGRIGPDYWVEHLRGAVRFADGIATVQGRKVETFIEVGPRPTLLGLGRSCVPAQYGTWLPSLKPKSEWKALLGSVAQLHVRGVDIDWAAVHSEQCAKVVLPNYPWQRQRYWIDASPNARPGPELHPLVHRKLPLAGNQAIFESNLSTSNPAYLADHLVFGNAVCPASALFEMAAVAGRIASGQADVALANVAMQRALVLSEVPATVQVVVTPDGQESRFEIFSRATHTGLPDQEEWVCHAAGALRRQATSSGTAQTNFDHESLSACDTNPIDLQALEQRFASRGVTYGPAFSAIVEIALPEAGTEMLVARLELPAAAGDAAAYGIHPVLLDAGLRMAEALFPEGDSESIFLPFAVGSMHARQAPPGPLWVRASGTERAATRSVDLEIFDATGERVATVYGLTLRPVSVFGLQRETARIPTTEKQLDQWLHQIKWMQISDPQPGETQLPPGAWLVVADRGNHAHRLAGALEERGASCLVVGHGANSEPLTADRIQPGDEDAGENARSAFERLVTEQAPDSLAGVIYLGALEASEDSYEDSVADALHLVQALRSADRIAPLWLVTRAAQAVVPEDAAQLSIWQSPLWGFGRTVQVEHPEFRCICVDLEVGGDDLAPLLDAVSRDDAEQQVAYRSGHRYVARLDQANLKPTIKAVFKLDREAAYLVTGGLGALGLEVAHFLVAAGARRLLLTGRQGASTKAQREAVRNLEKSGAEIEVVAADISVSEDVARVLEIAGTTLRGIVHAAGILDDGMLTQQTADRFSLVARPKVRGAWHLHQQTLEHPLDFFVLFSSVASIVGSAGQSNYATANAFMDGLAHWRRQRDLPALSINWGPWADVGMASTETVLRRLMNDGWQPMTSQQACHAMARLLGQTELPQAGVIPLDWAAFAGSIPGASEWPYLADLLADADASSDRTASAAKDIATQAMAAPPQERSELLTKYLKERVAQTLRVSTAVVDEHEPLSNLGMDSLTAVELRSWIQLDLGVELAVEQMFTTPTVGELAIAVAAELGGDAKVSAGSSAEQGAVPTASQPGPSAGWVVRPSPNPDARVRLFCFPFAGGGASMYREWSDPLPTHIELCLLQLPGREERLHESPLHEMAALVEAITAELAVFADKPLAFFGHSMGAMIAFEVARNLRDKGGPVPVHLFLSARQAPQIGGRGDEPLSYLPDREFMDKLHDLYGAVPEAIRESPRLQEIFLPVLRADVTLLETHEFIASDPLECPITVFGGEQDPHISPDMLSAWRDQTRARFSQQCFAGDHFYIVPARAAVTAAIASALA